MLKHKCFSMRVLVFTLVLAVCLSWSWQVLKVKCLTKANIQTITYLNFYELPKNSLDVIFLGSSHAMEGFIPQTLYDKFGITSYSLSGAIQPVVISYYWLKEALNYQRPKAVVIDAFMFFRSTLAEETKIRTALDFMRWGRVKVEAVNTVCKFYKEHSWISYYLPNVRYHDRWKSLDESDFRFEEILPEARLMEYAGAFWGQSKDKYQTFKEGSSTEEAKMLPHRLEYLEKLVSLCKENGIQLIIVKTPTKSHNIEFHNTLNRFAKENQVPFYDMNEESLFNEIGIEFNKDIADYGHANLGGSVKLTEYIGNLLQSEYGLLPHKAVFWESTRREHEKMVSDYNLKDTKDLSEYLSILSKNMDRYTIFIAVKDEASKSLNDQAKAGLKDLGLKPDWTDAYRKSYYALIEKGTVKLDEISEKQLKHKGSYDNGNYVYSIESAGNKVGNNCSIKINNKEQAKRRRGLNFVIFSNERHVVIDSVCFDTFDKNNKCFR